MKIIFLDKRCIRFGVQLGLFCAPDCVGLILYAQSSSRCVKRVSQTRWLYLRVCVCVRLSVSLSCGLRMSFIECVVTSISYTSTYCSHHIHQFRVFLVVVVIFKYIYIYTYISINFSICGHFRRRSEFSNEKNRVDRRVQYYKFRNRQMFVTAMSAYLDWITQAGFYFDFVFTVPIALNTLPPNPQCQPPFCTIAARIRPSL